MAVYMFHSLGLENSNWVSSYLSIPYHHFDNWFSFLMKHNYNTAFLNEWYQAQEQDFATCNKTIYLTFDDGYLDNWVFLFPLLRKHNVKATIFVNPEFCIEGAVRSTLEDVWQGKLTLQDLKPSGFLNWEEIRIMQDSGLVDIQSHSMSHNWYFTTSIVQDIYSHDKYKKHYWVNWFLNPHQKPDYINNDYCESIPTGYPIFERGRSLAIRRYFPNMDLINHILTNKYETIGQYQKLLLKAEFHGRMETDTEMTERYYYELKESKRLLEEKLKKSVDFLCWPGGGYNNFSVEISSQVGYKASTIASWDSKHDLSFNKTSTYKRIPRQSLGVNINYKGKQTIDYSPDTLKSAFIENKGSLAFKYRRYLKKIYCILFK